MLQGRCLDADILPTYETFYLFPVGKGHVYAARFPRKSAHTGCYEKKHFQVVEVNKTAEWHPEPPKRTDAIECQVLYSAKLIWCWEHSKKLIGQTYFVIARGEGLHVDVYANADLTNMLGCFPIHWFENFKVVGREAEIETEETAPEQVLEEENFEEPEEPTLFEQMKLF